MAGLNGTDLQIDARNNLWFTGWDKGLIHLVKDGSGRYRALPYNTASTPSLSSNTATSVLVDNEQRLVFVSTSNGLNYITLN